MSNILIVEDDRTVRQALVFAFQSEGYEVVGVEDLSRAEQVLDKSHFDLVITDLILRLGNGLKVMETVQKRNSAVPMIVITAYPESELGKTAKQVFGKYFFEKPLDMNKLKETVWELQRMTAVTDTVKAP
jgi:DNA-binding NtrC family response regulator